MVFWGTLTLALLFLFLFLSVCLITTLLFLFPVSKQSRFLWILTLFVPLLCLIACYVPPQDSDSHHLLSHTLLWWPWPTPFGQATHRFVRGICRNLYLYCVVSWPHIGAAKWNFWIVKSLTLPQLAATWVCIFEHLRKHTLEFVNRWEDLLWFWWSAMNVESILFNATRSLLMGFVIWPNSIFTYLVRFLLL